MITTRAVSLLGLSRREEWWKDAEILMLRHQLAVAQRSSLALIRVSIREALAFGKALYDIRTALGPTVAELALRAALTDDAIERIEEIGSVWIETHAA